MPEEEEEDKYYISEGVDDFLIKLDNIWETNVSIQGEKVLRGIVPMVGNGINKLDPSGGKAMDYIASGFDADELEDDNVAGDIWNKHVTEQNVEIEKLSQRAQKLDTGKGIYKGIKEGSIPDVALGITNALVSTVTTLVPAFFTRGATLLPQVAVPMYTEYNSEKAKTLYPDDDFETAISKLHANGEDDWVAPAALGVTAALLERAGVTGITNAILNRAKTAGTKRAIKFIMAGMVEGGTEWFQGGIQEVSTAIAQQEKDPNVIAGRAWDHMLSDEGIEEFLQGFAGGGITSSVGNKISRAFRGDKDNLIINDYVNQLGELNQSRLKSYSPEVKQSYDKKIKEVQEALKNHLILDQTKSTYLTEEQSFELLDILDSKQGLDSKINKLNKQRKRGAINEQDYNMTMEDMNVEVQKRNKRINDIKVDANKKLLNDELRTTDGAMSRINGMSQKVYKTQGDFLTAVNSKQKNNGGKIYTAEDLRYADGLIVDGEVMINEVVAAENNAITVGSHELLHGIVKSSLNGETRTVKDSNGNDVNVTLTKDGEQLIREFRDSLTTKERNIVQKRIDDNYKFNKDGSERAFEQYAEEYITAYSDAAGKGQITPGVLTKIQKFFEKTFNSGDKGYKNLNFETGKDVKEFLQAYNEDRKQGKFRDQFVSMAQEGVDMDSGGTIKQSITKKDLTDKEKEVEVNKLGEKYTDNIKTDKQTVNFEVKDGNYYWQVHAEDISDEIQKQGYLDGLILEQLKDESVNRKDFLNTSYERLFYHLKNYKPERNLAYKEENPNKATGLFGWLNPQIGNKTSEAYNIITEGEVKNTTQIGETTKEGDIKIQLEADEDLALIDLETRDMSPAAEAKRAKEASKKKEQRYSKLRQDIGIKKDSDLYNKVKDSARKSLILAYKKTRNIKDKDVRVTEVAKMIADEYAGEKGITSGKYTELFKLIKNSLGEKQQYITNLKKNRESIVESIFTSDFVQIEKKVTESERVFTVFKEKLTSQPQVESAVNKGLLPKDSLKTIDKGQSVNLYKKVMPNPNEFVGFFDQPLITSEGKRSGLKGTRKDGLAKHLSKALIFDALIEVRQEQFEQELETLKKETQDLDPKAQQKLIEEFEAQLDVVELAAKISREVDVKFSKSNAVTDMNNAMDLGVNTGVYSEIRFSKSHREQYEKQLNKRRPDLTEEQRKNAVQSVFDFVDGKDIPNNKKAKYEKMAMHYTANGFLILPEDGYKVIEAERIATIKKLDPFSYKNPNVLIEDNVVKEKVKRTDPDTVGTFSNKTEHGNGVVVYNVEDSKKGQKDVRKVIDTHFGKNSNPWCLVARQKEEIMDIPDMETFDTREEAEAMKMVFEETGRYETVNVVPFDWNQPDGSAIPQWFVEANEPKKKPNPNYDELEEAWVHWKSYNKNTEGLGFRIAFHNGELVAFRDGKKSPRWWDRADKAFKAPVIRDKKGKDGFKLVSLAYKNRTEAIFFEKQVGDNKNGTYTKRRLDGVIVIRETKKDGKLHGEQMAIRENASSFYDTKTTTTHDANSDSRGYSEITEERFYKDFRSKSGIDKISFGIDDITLDNITNWKMEMSETDNTSVRTIEGTVNQKYFNFFKDPSTMKKDFPSYTLEQLTYAHSRYYGIQGKKVKLVITGQNYLSGDISLTIDGVEQSFNPKFSETRKRSSQLQLTELQYNRKPEPALLGAIQEIDKRIQENTASETDLYLKNNLILESMMEGFKQGLPSVDVYNTVMSKLPEDPSSYGADFSSVENFIQFIKNTTMVKVRSVGYEASKKMLDADLKHITDPATRTRIQNEYYINVGRSTRSGMVNDIRTNEQLQNDLKPLMGEDAKNYRLEPTKDGKGKKTQYNNNGKWEDVVLYNNIEEIKNNARNNPELVKLVNEQAKDASRFVMKVINHETLSDAEKTAIIELISLDQRGAIRKMAKMGITLTPKSKLRSKDLVLEHEYPIAELVGLLKKRIKEGPKVQAELYGVIDRMRVHVLPKEIDTLLNAAGLKSKGGFTRYTYNESIVNFFADQSDNGNIEVLPESSYAAFDNQKLIEVIEQASKSKKPKGISILDFDDTLATSSSLIRFTRPDGTKGTLTPEQYASTYKDLSGMNYEFDFSEFNKVVDGKPAPLLNKAKKLAGKFGTENMFILTARPQQSAVAIQKFLKENGLNIPLKNITGLGNSTADAKALWVLNKANEGFNDFYFADDAIQNVQAVQNMLDQIDVKSKVQQAIPDVIKQKVKFSKLSLKNTINSPQYKKFRNNIKNRVLYHGGSETINTIRNNNAVWFYLDDIEAAQLWGDGEVYSVKVSDIQDMVVLPDLNDVGMFTDHIQEKFNLKEKIYDIREILKHPKADEILTEWMDWSSKNDTTYDIGYNLYEKGNVTNGAAVTVLGVIPKNKIQQVSPKFSKSSLRGNEAVNNLLSQIDVKSKVQQARVDFSKSKIDTYFNNILEDISGINANQTISEKLGEARGKSKGKFRYFVPPSHEDFVGLLYNFMGKGKKGNNHRDFFNKVLIKPLNKAYRTLNAHKQVIANNYKKLSKHMPQVTAILGDKVPSGDFTYEDAVRIYLWNKAGYKIPGISAEQEATLVGLVKEYSDLQKFADMLGRVSLIKEGYVKPGDNWLSGSIKFDLVDATGRVGRAKFFKEFIDNAEIIFGKLDNKGRLKGDNINKIESIYGKDFREALEDMLYRTVNGTNRPSGSNKMVNAWLDWINGSVGAIMFFNMRSAILQQLSIANFMNFADNNVAKAAARFADQKQFWDDFTFLFNSDYLKQRRAGAAFDVNANEIAREVSGAKSPVRVVIRKLLDIGFTPTQIGDSFAIATGGASFYRNRVNTYIKQGFSKKDAQSKAFLDFQEIAEETQQSARPDMISQQQASPLGRFILAFQNVTSQYARIVKKSSLDLIKRRISKGYTTQSQSDTANISRIMYYGAIQSVIFYGLQQALFAMMFSDDEEDEEFFKTKKDRVVHGVFDSLLKGSGVLGAVISTLKNYAIKFVENQKSDSFFKTPAWEELLQIAPPIGIKIRKWRSLERTIDWNKDVIKNMTLFSLDNPIYDAISSGVEGFTNIPLNRLYKKVQNIRAAFDSETAWWQRISLALGWSKWDVGIDSKINKKDFKDKGQEKENKELQKIEKEEGKKVLCAAVSNKGTRCGNEVLRGGSYCTIHVSVEESKSGEKKQCKGRRTTGGRCKMQTNSKSGYCYYHD